MSSAFSAAIARISHHLPSKRKLDDYASPPSDPLSDPLSVPLAMRNNKQSPFPFDSSDLNSRSSLSAPSLSAPSSFISSLSSSSAASSSSSVSSSSPLTLHFFVRTDSRTLVLHAHPTDTIKSVIDQIRVLTGIPTTPSDHRFIYRGCQLDPDSTLARSAVETDACLHLTARLRSTRFPRAWRLVHDLDKTVRCLLSNRPAPREIPSIDSMLTNFLASPPTGPRGEIEDGTLEYLHVFVLGCAPASLVKLYVSDVPNNRIIADRAVRLFLNPVAEFLPKSIQVQCWMIVLDFCKLIAGTKGKTDPLYVSCRSTLGSLLEAQGGFVWGTKIPDLVAELFPFVKELAGITVEGLSSETMFVSSSELAEFASFLVAMRWAVKEWMGGGGQFPKSLLETNSHPRYEGCIYSLHAIYLELLGKVDECLKKVDNFLAGKAPVQSDNRWVVWSHILVVLTNMHSFSKIYEGAPALLHAVLLNRRASVNALIRRAKKNEKLRWLLKRRDVIDFESKRSLVMMLFPEGKDDYEHLHEMLIDRTRLLTESFEYIGPVDAQSLHGGLFMEFKNEEATGPGVLREWFCLVCRAIFNPQNVLFLPCPNDRRRFFPNPASTVDPLHLKYFGFCGRVVALALMHKVQVGVVFDRAFFLQLAGKIVTLVDIKDADPFLYMSCKKILEMDAELLDSDVLGLTFVREIEELGTQRAVELREGGKDMVVNSKNREEYIKLLIQHRFVKSVSEQVSHFARGFSDILSNTKFQKFFFNNLDLEDFDRMIGGSNSIINVREWKSHTEYSGYKAKDRQICWFWKIVEGMSEEQRRVLLFFWTSVKYLPVDGFGGLASKLYIYKASDSNGRLPTSHTCFYRLCLPQYSSISLMRDKLQFITQEHVSCTFGMW